MACWRLNKPGWLPAHAPAHNTARDRLPLCRHGRIYAVPVHRKPQRRVAGCLTACNVNLVVCRLQFLHYKNKWRRAKRHKRTMVKASVPSPVSTTEADVSQSTPSSTSYGMVHEPLLTCQDTPMPAQPSRLTHTRRAAGSPASPDVCIRGCVWRLCPCPVPQRLASRHTSHLSYHW